MLAMGLSLLVHGLLLFGLWMTLPRLLATGQAALEPLLVRLTAHADSAPGEPAVAPLAQAAPKQLKPPLTEAHPEPPKPLAVTKTKPARTADSSQARDAESAAQPRQAPAPVSAGESPQFPEEQSATRAQLPHAQASVTDSGAARSQYLAAISACLAREQHYPARARRMGIQGTVSVSFVVAPTGHVSGLRVLHGAGNADLDRAALRLVRRCAPFAPLPATLGGELVLELPVRYRLQ